MSASNLNRRTILRSGAAAALAGSGIGLALAQAPVIKMGVIGPLTGPGAAWGLCSAEGMMIAADEANAEGGLLVGGTRYRIDVTAYDDRYRAAEALSAYNRLVQQDGAKYLMITSSASALALKESIEKDGVVGFTAAFSRKVFDQNTRYMYRIYTTPNEYGPPMIAWARKRFASIARPKVVILNPNDETGWDVGEMEKREFAAKGFEVVAAETYERDVKEFQPMLARVLARKPDLIELGASLPATSGLIVRQARELGFEGHFIKVGGSAMQGIIDTAGAKPAEGLICMTQADMQNEAFLRIAKAYQARRGHLPNESLVSVYDAAKVMHAAIVRGGAPNDTTKFGAALPRVLPMKSLQGDTLSLTGKDNYGTDSQLKSTLLVGEIRSGKPVVLERIET